MNGAGGSRPQGRSKPGEAPYGFARRSEPKATVVFDTYWRFAAARQAILFSRLKGVPAPWTDDPILREFRFTNAYRAADRVSQYLIQNVIYDKDRGFTDTFFRILLFKIFNRIETWELLEESFGELDAATFRPGDWDKRLERERRAGNRIYSAAYIMPSGGRSGVPKHRFHLELLATMLKSGLPTRIRNAGSMRRAYALLLEQRSVGPFLAYQWATDLNYSAQLGFDEMEFVMPGPGALDGIRKCFSDPKGWDTGDLIRKMADEQECHFERLGLRFQSLWGRRLQLIDCQNLFCEVDKYARVAHPSVKGRSGRQRIKQKFRASRRAMSCWFPPKWRLNGRVEAHGGVSSSQLVGSGSSLQGAGQ